METTAPRAGARPGRVRTYDAITGRGTVIAKGRAWQDLDARLRFYASDIPIEQRPLLRPKAKVLFEYAEAERHARIVEICADPSESRRC